MAERPVPSAPRPAASAENLAHGPKDGAFWRAMHRWIEFWAVRRGWFIAILIAIGAALGAASARIRWNPDVLRFFSAKSAMVRDIRASANHASATSALRFDLHFKAAPGGPRNGAAGARRRQRTLRAAARVLGKKLRATGGFQQVFTHLALGRREQAVAALYAQAPILVTGRQRAVLRRRMRLAWLRRRFAQAVARLAAPDGQIEMARLVHDPLDVAGLLAKRFESINPFPEARLIHSMIFNGHGRHCLLLATPRLPPTDTPATTHMLHEVHHVLNSVRHQFPGVRVWWIGPYRNYSENARRMKRDIGMIGLVGSAAILLAVWLYFRRAAALVICVAPPFIGLGMALGLAGLAHATLPLLALGFSGLLLGSTTDYGIQLIAACNGLQDAGGWRPEHRAMAARRVFGPISMSVATSVTGYGALAFSSAWGLERLGLFIAAATVGIYVVTFAVLPVFLGPAVVRARRTPGGAPEHRAALPCRARFAAAWVFIAATLALGLYGVSLNFNRRLSSFDGSRQSLKTQQKKFFHTWGDLRRRAGLLVTAPTASAALARLAGLTKTMRTLAREKKIAGFSSPAALLPDDAVAQKRMAAWHTLFNQKVLRRLRHNFTRLARANGLHAGAWNPTVAALAHPHIPPDSLRLRDSPAALFPGEVRDANGHFSIAASITLPRAQMGRPPAWVKQVRAAAPGVHILSGALLLAAATAHAREQFRHLMPLVVLLIAVPLFLYFRKIWLVMAAGISLVAGLAWLFGAAQLDGGLNILAVVPVLFTLGVAIDYGIYAATDPAWRAPPGALRTRTAATAMCAGTTLLGTGAMLLATHPMLRWIGLMLIAGIGGGYLASLLLVGPFVAARLRNRAAVR